MRTPLYAIGLVGVALMQWGLMSVVAGGWDTVVFGGALIAVALWSTLDEQLDMRRPDDR